MSVFSTFLTSGPACRRRRGKVDLQEKFLRESNKYFPKSMKPKVNVMVNPVVNYMTNLENRKQEQELRYQTTMKYKSCSQIVPTNGLSNLVFYDCHKKLSSPSERSIEDSISKLEPTLSQSTEDRYTSEFFEQEVTEFNDFDEFIRAPQTSCDRSVGNSTLASNFRSSLLSSGIHTDTSFETDLSHQGYDHNDFSNIAPQSDTDLYEMNFNDESDRLSNHTEPLDADTFDVDLTTPSGENTSNLMEYAEPLNVTGFSSPPTSQSQLNVSGLGCQLLNSPDWRVKSTASHTMDESLAKFAVSSCSDISFEEIDGRDLYLDFVPLYTSTPKAVMKANSRNDRDSELIEMSALSVITTEFVPLFTSSPIAETKVRSLHGVDNEPISQLLFGEESFFNQEEEMSNSRINFEFSDQFNKDDLFLDMW